MTGLMIRAFFAVVLGLLFIPTTVLLCVGMLPAFVAVFTDKNPKKRKSIAVGCVNFVGCVPFLMDLWLKDHSLDHSLGIVSNPGSIVVMYFAAGVGYFFEWFISSTVSSFLHKKDLLRQKKIKERQAELLERWGVGVKGTVPLDQHGFVLQGAAVPDEGSKSKPKG